MLGLKKEQLSPSLHSVVMETKNSHIFTSITQENVLLCINLTKYKNKIQKRLTINDQTYQWIGSVYLSYLWLALIIVFCFGSEKMNNQMNKQTNKPKKQIYTKIL